VPPDDPIDRLTGSVSDGAPVDWEQVGAGPELDEDTVEAMREVARIAEFNRSLQRASTPAVPSSSPPLERWRDLTLLEPIGTGSRGEVWRAWDATLQRQVALKFLQPSAMSEENPTALLNEARALARVRHPGIVTVFGIGEDQGRVGMWMDCVPGITLAREIERVGPLPPRSVASIGLQLSSALEALDAADLVHRDIKPANILLEGERVLLTDFGLGWRASLDDAAPRMSGTPLFMAPELLAGAAPTHLSDLYALGVTLWWALAGRAPFEARTLAALREEAAHGPSRSLHAICPDAPRDLVAAILAAMSPNPSERIRSASDLMARLRSLPYADNGPQPSIAVLPFVNRSPDHEDDYFSDGLTDDLIGMLGKIRGMRVAARTSAFRFRDRQATIGEIGRALNVDMVLDGSVRRSGDRIRISVQLVMVSDGLHIWSETYDRTLDDIFAVQDDIAQSAVNELRVALRVPEPPPSEGRSELAAAAVGRSSDPAAHRLYLLGRHFGNRLTREDVGKALEHLERAVALDPNFALAWAELGGTYRRAASYGLRPQAEAIENARGAVRRALSIEPRLAEAHARMGAIQKFHDWDWEGAEASFRRALELAPGDSVTLNGAAVLAMVLGRFEESLAFQRRAVEQDPLSATAYSNYGLMLYRAGRSVEAETALRRALELAPERYLTHSFIAMALLDQGRHEEALEEAQREADEGQRWYALAIVHHVRGNRRESDGALRALAEAHARVPIYEVQIARVHAIRGEADAAFAALDRAYERRDFGLAELRGDASYRSLHSDPRWPVLLARMGFTSGGGT
jgi:serine/threonine-protein kinase